MKSLLRNSACCLFALTLASLCTLAVAQGQSREEHFISARAGVVNLVSGDVSFQSEGSSKWERLSAERTLGSGDLVRTGAGGTVEVLLNPGSYVRLAANSEFELSDASLESLGLRLVRGSAIIEATGFDKSETLIAVTTPQTQVSIVRSGIYRLNVLPPNATELFVRKGRAFVGAAPGTLVKGGRVARVVAGAAVEVAKFDKDDKDEFDLWSRERARTLAKLNDQLAQRGARRSLNTLLASTNFDDMLYGGRRHYGLWVYSRGAGCYTFLPFYAGWPSPYGGNYGSGVSWNPDCYSCPGTGRPVVTNNPTYPGGGVAGGASPYPSSGGGSGGGGGQGPIARPEPVAPRPEISRPEMDRPSRADRPRSIVDQQ